jgi:hypothetical protein
MGLSLKAIELAAAALIGEAITHFGNANAYLGVGDDATAFANTQTDLQGANKYRVAVDVGYPTRSTRTLTWKATVDGDHGNWNWLEEGVFNASSAGDMFCREVEDLGTKGSGSVWVLTITGTLAACA